jgi:DNA-binding transcriptional LysR family regulator
LRILANTSAMTETLPADLAAFACAHPGIRVAASEMWSADIVRAVQSGEADLGVVVEGVPATALDLIPYSGDRIAAVLPVGHSLANREPFRFVDVLEHDIVGLESDSSMMQLLARQAVAAGMALHLHTQVRSFEVVCRLVESGVGLGLLPDRAATSLRCGTGLVIRPFPEPWAQRRMMLCVRKERPAAGPIALLIAHLQSAASTDHQG